MVARFDTAATSATGSALEAGTKQRMAEWLTALSPTLIAYVAKHESGNVKLVISGYGSLSALLDWTKNTDLRHDMCYLKKKKQKFSIFKSNSSIWRRAYRQF